MSEEERDELAQTERMALDSATAQWNSNDASGAAAGRELELLKLEALEASPIAFLITTRDGTIVWANPAIEAMTGYAPSELAGQTPRLFKSGQHSESFYRELWETILAGRKWQGEMTNRRKDGSLYQEELSITPVRGPHGEFSHFIAAIKDVSARWKAEEALRQAHNELNRAVAEASDRQAESEKLTELVDMIQCCQSREKAFQIVAEVLESIFPACAGALYLINTSHDEAEAMAHWGPGGEINKIFRPDDCWALRRGKVHVAADAKSATRCDHAPHASDSGHICIPLVAHGETLGLLYFEFPADSPGRPAQPWKRLAERAAVVGERLSLALANLQLREELRQQSVRDVLTGLFNRRYMEETLDRELSRAARYNESVAVAICDLDRFKDFNDIFGHDAGDLLLREVAGVMTANVRQSDVVCRLGGEEFVVILPGANLDIAWTRLETIRKQVQSISLNHRNRTLDRVTISSGLAAFPKDGASSEDLLHAADKALYRAKREGRNRVAMPFTSL